MDEKKNYNTRFYDNHIGEKQKCIICDKEISIFNFSHHKQTQKHKENLKKYQTFKSKVNILKKAEIDKKTYNLLQELL